MGAANCSVEDLTADSRRSADSGRNGDGGKNLEIDTPTKSDDAVFIPDIHAANTSVARSGEKTIETREEHEQETKVDDLPPTLPVKQKAYGQVVLQIV